MAGARGALTMMLALGLTAPAATAHAQSLEYAVKANYLVRFAAFVEWPIETFAGAAADAPFVICVIGRDPFGRTLDEAAATQTAVGRRISVRRTATLDGCHVAYLGAGAAPEAVARPVLMVSDEAVSPRRAMVHFVLVDNRVRFHIDQRAAAQARLGMSSRLLNLAVSVGGAG